MNQPTTVPDLLRRIEVNPEILVGQPVVRGTRIPVSLIVNYLEHGHGVEDLLDDYPALTREDVEAAEAYAKLERERTEVHSW